jgi:hypothetical protein
VCSAGDCCDNKTSPHTPMCHGVPLLSAGLRVSVATAVAATSPAM